MGDRPVFLLCLGIMIVAVAAMIYFGLHAAPKELQIATRFSSFGETSLYRNKWYYMLSFPFFLLLVSVSHVLLVAKLVLRDMRQQAIAFGWLTLLLLVVSIIVISAIFGIAYPV